MIPRARLHARRCPLVKTHPFVVTVLAVKNRLREVRAAQLVSSIALRAFYSIFPLLLVAISVLGFVARNNADLGADVVRKLKLTGDMDRIVRDSIGSAKGSAGLAGVIGIITALWSGLKVVTAIAAASDAAWQVPERGLRDKLRGVPWLLGFVVLSGASAVATFIAQRLGIPYLDLLLGYVLGVVSGTLVFLWTHMMFTNAKLPLRAHLAGALVGGAGFTLFQLFGARITAQLTKSSELYKTVGAVFGFLTLLSIFAWMHVLSAVVNVVLWERKHGTHQVSISVPALPASSWSVVQRGGQRAKPPKEKAALPWKRRVP
jgi:membrane protein